MFKKLVLTLCALHLSASPAHAGLKDTYLCVAEQATGFIEKKDGAWDTTKFNTDNSKYLIKPIGKGDQSYRSGFPFAVVRVGRDKPEYLCQEPDASKVFGLYCLSAIGSMVYSSETGNYIRTNTSGYWTKIQGTPHIERGKCSKL